MAETARQNVVVCDNGTGVRDVCVGSRRMSGLVLPAVGPLLLRALPAPADVHAGREEKSIGGL